MISLQSLQNNSIIITPNGVKELLIKQINNVNPPLNFKFISKEELLKNSRPVYDNQAILFLHENNGYSYDAAIELLDNIMDSPKINQKLTLISNLYQELIDKKLLYKNDLFDKLFINKKVYIYGYSTIDQELLNIVTSLTSNYEYLTNDNQNVYSHKVIEYSFAEEEVAFFFENVAKLVNNKVSLNNIYLYRYDDCYDSLIKKYAHYYNIPIYYNDDLYIYDTPIFKSFIKEVSIDNSNEPLVNSYEKICERFSYDPLKVLDKIATIVNKVYNLSVNLEEKINFINELAKKSKVSKIKYEEAITICDSSYILSEQDYVFILGFDVSNYPLIHKDTDFYTDEEKLILGLNTSNNLNKMEVEGLTLFLNSTKNVVITFKKYNESKECYLSTLCNQLDIKKEIGSINNVRYVNKLAEIEVAKLIDTYYSYGLDHIYRKALDYEKIGYNDFKHRFKELEDFKLNQTLKLSYTQISEYNSCPFQYFIKRILKANIFEERFVTNVGTLFHNILEDSLSKTIDINDYNDFINEKFTTNKEKYFLKLIMPQIEAVIKFNNGFQLSTNFNKWLPEVNIKMQLDENTFLEGKIDKMMFDEENHQAVVVDYKSGSFKFDEKKVEYGIGMQLPLYHLLMNEQYPDYEVVGLYIQSIWKEPDHDIDTIFEVKLEYPLDGITLNDLEVVKRLDNMIDEATPKSTYINGIRLTKKGLRQNKNLYEYGNFKDLVQTSLDKTLETSENIRKGNFAIKPKFFGENGPCKYCPCRDICFVKEDDKEIIDLSKKEETDEI